MSSETGLILALTGFIERVEISCQKKHHDCHALSLNKFENIYTNELANHEEFEISHTKKQKQKQKALDLFFTSLHHSQSTF